MKKLKDIYNNIKWFIQRGIRGYADCDIWDLDYYLSEILPRMLKQLKKNQHILPTWKDGESEEVAQKRWDSYINKMINTFETAKQIAESDYVYTESCTYDSEENKEHRLKIKDMEFLHIMTKEECEQYEEGWRLFQKYFFKLWD